MATADGLADACGLHVAEESEIDGEGGSAHTSKEVWIITAFTFISVCGFTLNLSIPILFFPLETAVPIAIAYGMLLLTVFNAYIAKIKNERPIKTILEHILLSVFVIIISYLVGGFYGLVCWLVSDRIRPFQKNHYTRYVSFHSRNFF